MLSFAKADDVFTTFATEESERVPLDELLTAEDGESSACEDSDEATTSLDFQVDVAVPCDRLNHWVAW